MTPSEEASEIITKVQRLMADKKFENCIIYLEFDEERDGKTERHQIHYDFADNESRQALIDKTLDHWDKDK